MAGPGRSVETAGHAYETPVLVLCVCGIAAVAVTAFFAARRNRPNSADLFPPLPNHNGYDDLLKAARSMTSGGPNQPGNSPEALSLFENENQSALDLIRFGLNRECRLPIQFSQTYLSTHMNELQDMKSLAQLLARGGDAARQEGKKADALRYYLDALRLSQAIARGGFVIDVMVAQACQAIGLKGLRSLRGSLTAAEAGELIRKLEALDHESEPMARVFRREKAYFWKSYGWWYNVASRTAMTLARLRGNVNPTQITENSLLRGQARLRLFLLEAALEAHRTENESYPESLAALNPRFHRGLPKDPFTGADFMYRRRNGAFLLYSVGPDRKDDGGIQASRQSGAGIPSGDILAE